MSDSQYEADAHGLKLNDFVFILFKHKWKILLSGTAGIVAAVGAYFLLPSVYESQAKLLVRYVVEKSAVDDPSVKTPGASDGMNLINSELEILTSQDLIIQVAEAVGIDQLLRKRIARDAQSGASWSVPEPELKATRTIRQNLRVTAVKETNIISVSYKNTNPDMAVKVLQELVSRYFDKHLEVHRSTGAFDFVRRETDQLRSQLNQTEKELKELDDRAGIISPAVTETNLTADLARAEEESSITGAELAAQQARVTEVQRRVAFTRERDLLTEKAALNGLEAKNDTLKARVDEIRERLKKFSELRAQLAELERRKEVQETNYKYFESTLERARIDETLDPSRMPNISVVQKPLTAEKYTKDKVILVISLALGGLAVGVAIAFLKELVIDRTVKRQVELETRLAIPLPYVLSIPYFSRNGHSPLFLRGTAEEARMPVAGPDMALCSRNEFMWPFCEAIRDRLILDFDLNGMRHRPKLVAVIGCSIGAGTTTIATELAASLSKTSEKVTLVDQLSAEKRWLITAFAESDFDYVVYDLPCLSDTSPTLALAGFMDRVLLVVEAEKSNREVVKRAYTQLASVKAKVLVVLNKRRSYGPKWLRIES